jgi:hypothetical protein
MAELGWADPAKVERAKQARRSRGTSACSGEVTF